MLEPAIGRLNPYRTIMHLLGCLFVFLFAGLLFVVAFAGLIIDRILVFLGFKKPRQYGPYGQRGGGHDFEDVDAATAHAGGSRQQHPSGHNGKQPGGKIFQKDDSEYVDFEEV